MHGGRVVEAGPCAEVFASPRDPYTQTLLSAVPTIDPEWEERRRDRIGQDATKVRTP